MPDIAGNTHHRAPWAALKIRLQPLANRAFSWPIFAGEALAHNRDSGRIGRVAEVKGAPLQHRNLQSMKVVLPHRSIAGNDLPLYGVWILSLHNDGHRRISAAHGQVASH